MSRSQTSPKKIMISSVMKDFTDVRNEIARVITKSQNFPIRAEDHIGIRITKTRN